MTLQESVKTLYKKLKYHIGNNGDAHALADEHNAGFISAEEKRIVNTVGGMDGNGYNLMPLTTLRRKIDSGNGFTWGAWDWVLSKSISNSIIFVDDATIPIVNRKVVLTAGELLPDLFIYQDIPASQKDLYRSKYFIIGNKYSVSAYVKSTVDVSARLMIQGVYTGDLIDLKAGVRTRLTGNFVLEHFNLDANQATADRFTLGIGVKNLPNGETIEIDSLKIGNGFNNFDFNHSLYELDTLYGHRAYKFFDYVGDIYTLDVGIYEFSGNGTNITNIPLQLKGQPTFIGVLHVFNGTDGRKQFILCHSGTNSWYVGNTHTSQTTIRWSRMTQTIVGTGNPNGQVNDFLGSLYVDLSNGYVYIKTSNTQSTSGWVMLQTTT